MRQWFQPRNLVPLAASLALLSCTHVFYQGDRNLYFPPSRLGFKPKEMHFKTHDGMRLFGWLFPPLKKFAGTVIQFHGNGENMSSHYLSLAWLTREGYQLLSFDYRGYGRSEGEPSQEGTYRDGLAALDLAWVEHKKLGPGAPFIVYGQSLGGAVALRCLDDFAHKNETALLVLDSTFLSYRRVAQSKLAGFWLTWPLSPLAWVLVSDAYGARDALSRNQVPLLVIHDRNDPGVPFAMAEEILARSPGPTAFWQLEQGRHIGVFAEESSGPSSARGRFLAFLKTWPASARLLRRH